MLGFLAPGPWQLLALVAIIGIPIWIWMLVDCLVNEPSQGNEKLIWVLVILLAGCFGALLYFIVRRPQRKREIGK